MKKRRKYQLKSRAETREQTRERITTAAMALHEELGPSRTSIAAIAERAGVQRLTVYRHFPDELALLRACGGRYRALHPPPDLAAWRAIEDPLARLHVALAELYAHFRETAAMWHNVLRDAELDPVLREAAEPRFRMLREATEILAVGWRSPRTGAAVALAVDFHTWQALARRELSDADMTQLMTMLALVAERGI